MLISSRSTCMHWPLIIENACPRCFSICEILSQYVWHLFSCYTLASPYRTMGSMWWFLHSDSTISLLRIAKYMLYLAAMVGSPSMACSLYNNFCNYQDSAKHSYDWSLLLVANWCSFDESWVCLGLEIVTIFLLSNSLIMSCQCIFPTWYTRFSYAAFIWSADTLWI